MKQFSYFISLGYFCSPALELERIGLRSTSLPFDWVISDFEGVIDAIENHFEDFLDYQYLLQSNDVRNQYYNAKYKTWFYHDFDEYHSLSEQLPRVVEKYTRRIQRFYEIINQPTLFLRYISDETKNKNTNRSVELEWIERNQERIVHLLKSYNSNNEIIFLANNEVQSDIIKIYSVDKDENDLVARRPLDKNSELKELLMSFDYEAREQNILLYNSKQKKNKTLRKLYRQVLSFCKHLFAKKYVHNQIYKASPN